MIQVKKSMLIVIVLLLLFVPAVFGQEAPANSAAGVAQTDSRFDTLAAALEAAGLVDDLSGGEWTLFAPTDVAFASIGLTPENIAAEFTTGELTDLLLYHVMKGDKSTATLKTMLGNVTMANGQLAGLKFYEDELYVNDISKLVEENIIVTNGRVHVVDNVILPPWPRVEEPAPTVAEALQAIAVKVAGQVQETVGQVQEAQAAVEAEAAAEPEAAAAPAVPENSIAGRAIADGRFTTLIAAVAASGLLDDLAGGEWTAFAPTDAAFAKLGLTAENVASEFSKEELADLLLYHLMKENNSTAQLKTQLGNVTMANGGLAGLKFYEDHIYVNDDSLVIQENIITDNGTIHVVDTVILPPWPRE